MHINSATVGRVLALACIAASGCRLPSDETLAHGLEARRTALDGLVRLCEQDKVSAAWDKGNGLQFQSETTIFSDREKQYEKLFDQAQIQRVWRMGNVLHFEVKRIGMAGHIAAGGYAYSREPIKVSAADERRISYKLVTDSWYTYRGKL
jgi:hypothetical protein